MKLVQQVSIYITNKYRLKDQEELRSYLTDKLVLILNKFDEGRNIPFECFARKSLHGYAFNFIRDQARAVKVPRRHSELNLRLKALQRKNPSLNVSEAAVMLKVSEAELYKAVEAANTSFTELNDYREFCTEQNSSNPLALNFLRAMDHNLREILEEIYLDSRPIHRVFQNRGITPQKGKILIKELVEKIQFLMEE